MKKGLVLLVGAAVLAAGIWVMVSSAGGGAVPVGVARDVEAGEVVPGPALKEAGTAEEEAVDVANAGFERSEVEAVEARAIPEDAERIRVKVVEKETGEPVPGAEVSYLMNRDMQEMQKGLSQEELMEMYRDQERVYRRYGRTMFADEEGVVLIPTEDYTSVVGRHGELFGQLTVQVNPPPQLAEDGYELELERDLTLLLRVLDSKGEPAVGVPIAFVPVYEEGNERRYYPSEVAKSKAPDGLATIPHVQTQTRAWMLQQPAPVGFLVRPYIPGLDEGGQAFDPAALQEEPLVLQLPPTGRVVVRTTDSKGELLPTRNGGLGLALAPEEPPSDLTQYRPPYEKQWRPPSGGDGETVFDWVVAGKDYVAMAYLSVENVVKIFQGPAVQDQEVHVMLSAGADVYSFVGRVLDTGREPMAEADLQLAYEFEGRSWGSSPLRTDERGFFRAPIRNVRPEMVLSRITIQKARSYPETEDTASYASTEKRSLVVGDNNLGDVIVGPTPVIASGRVVVDGEPAEGIQYFNFQVQILVERGSGTRTVDRWDSKPELSVRVKDEGRFEVVGARRPVRHRILGMYDWMHLPFDPVEFDPGAEDLEINLQSGGMLQAVALVDEDVPLDHLVFQVVPLEGQYRKPEDPMLAMYDQMEYRMRGQFTGKEDGRSSFQWMSLWPGSYRFEALAQGSEPLFQVDDVQIVAGERNRDSRLDGIDLRGKIRMIRVKVVGTNGLPLPETNYGSPVVVIDKRGEGIDLGGYSVQNGSVSVLVTEPYVDLLVLHRGYQPVQLNGVTADTRVTLEPFPEVVLRIAGMPRLPAGYSLTVSASKKERERDQRRMQSDDMSGSIDMWLRPSQGSQAVGDSGEVRLQVEGDGVHTLRVSVMNDSERRSTSVRGIEPAEIEVRTSMGEQVFELRIPEAALRDALQRVGGE